VDWGDNSGHRKNVAEVGLEDWSEAGFEVVAVVAAVTTKGGIFLRTEFLVETDDLAVKSRSVGRSRAYDFEVGIIVVVVQ